MQVAISGASGFIGTALVRFLERGGHRVIRLVRPSSKGGGGADVVEWDPPAARIASRALEGVDAVVNLAGVGIADARWTDRRKDAILQSRLDATRLLAATVGSLQRPPAVFVSASAIGYYGDGGDTELTEHSDPGDDFLARVCVAWEAAAEPVAASGVRVAWIRSGIVIDPAGGMLARLLLPFRLGLGGRVGPGTQYMSWISLGDELRAIGRIIDDPDLVGAVNLTAPNPVTNAEFTATLGKVLRRPTAIPTPLLPLRLRFGSELVRHLLLDSQRVLPVALTEAGFEFRHVELEPALRSLLGPGDHAP
jgi:uncharacterized protein (TIGR01777 family)